MSNRHQRRADLRAFKRAAPALRTYLCQPDDRRLDGVPLLRAAADDWLGALTMRCRHCVICSARIIDRRDVGALLLSVPDVAAPTSAGTAAVCLTCWESEPPMVELEQACTAVLRSVIPHGRFEPLEPRR